MTRRSRGCLALLAWLSGAVLAQEPPPVASTTGDGANTTLKRVEINGRRDETEQRRLSTAAKIVIGREEIEQFGDTTLADVMKRLRSVTIGGRPGRGGQIRMRGMGNGYTQILIDGERIPRGFSIDQLTPDMVERIEILRAPTAETGARAIAGTINIVLREPLRQRGDDFRVGAVDERGGVQPNFSWTRNDVLGEHGTYNLTVSGNHVDQHTDTATYTTYTNLATGAVDLAQALHQRQHDLRNALHLSGKAQWQLGDGDQFSLQPFLSVTEGHTDVDGTLGQTVGSGPAPYVTSASAGGSHSALGRLVAEWRKRLGDASRLDLRASIGRYNSNSQTGIVERDDLLAEVLDQRSTTSITDRSWTFSAKLSQTLAEKHSLLAGLEAEGVARDENALTLIDGTPSLPGFDGDVNASTRRYAAYAQDDWDPAPAWSVNGGLRWERIETRSASYGDPVANTSIVLTPLFHVVWRFDEPSRDQVRLSLTRSYRAPTLQNVIAVPTLSTLYPAPGPNTASSPDKAGNPALRPELATGIDLALEHYLSRSGVLSASVFRRDIRDLIRSVTALETMPWAATQRWVSRPQNIGDAVTQGIEFDAKFRLDEFVADAPPLSVRANLSVYGSKVGGVPGPYNRIDQQPRASGNLGGDYRWKGLPLTVGANFSWVPPYTIQQTELQSATISMTRVFDAYALWALSPSTRLRISLGNFVPRRYVTSSTILASGQSQTVVADGPTYRTIGLRLETRL